METTISKNKTASVEMKSGGKYSYKYVDIAQIHDYLERIGMTYYQFIDRIEGDDYIMTVKVDKDGIESAPLRGARVVDATLFGVTNPAQQQGSALTYARRYSLLMAFGLATEDDDAQSLSGDQAERKATTKQIEVLASKYTGENLTKLLEVNKIERLEDLPISKASELIGKLRGGR
jgi:hypothetical protein